MKACIHCEEEKPLSEYYKHPRMADGYLGSCKVCCKERATANRNNNLERIQAYDRARGNRQDPEYAKEHYWSDPVRARRMQREWSAENKESVTKSSRRWAAENMGKRLEIERQYRKNFPKVHLAHIRLHNALNQEILERQPCEVCREVKVEAHHCDYDHALNVMWLCRQHHADWHRENGHGLNRR